MSVVSSFGNWLNRVLHRLMPSTRCDGQRFSRARRGRSGTTSGFRNYRWPLRMLALEDRVTPAIGALDPSFDGDGLVTTRFPASFDDFGRSVAIDSAGRMVAVGFSDNGSNLDFSVLRYTASGSLDPTFGNAGIVTFPIGAAADEAYAVAVDSADRVIVVGSTFNGSNSDFAIARLTTAGVLDSSFDSDGKQVFSFGVGNDIAFSVAVDSLDRVVAAGWTSNGSDNDFAVVRLTTSGSFDSTFDTDGKQSIGIGLSDDLAFGVTVDSANQVIVAGHTLNGSNYDFAVTRLTTGGTLDTTFDTDGIKSFAIGSSDDEAFAVTVDSTDRIVVAGRTIIGATFDIAVARLTTAGGLDATFDTDGLKSFPIGLTQDEGFGVAVDSADRIVVGGRSFNGSDYDFAAARLDTAGALDATFDADGIRTIAIGSSQDEAFGVAVDSADRPVLAGRTLAGSTYDFATARLTTGGALDGTFDSDGIQTTDFKALSSAFGRSTTIDSVGRIIVAGFAYNGTDNDFAIVRYLANGSLDGSFGTGGVVTFAIGTAVDNAYGVAVDSLDRIVVAGYSENGAYTDIAVARLTTAGALDPSFDTDGKQTIAIGARDDAGYAVAVDSADRIIVAGYTDNGTDPDFAVVRLTTSGALDVSFDTDGIQSFAFGVLADEAYAVAVDSADQVVVAGRARFGGNFDFAVARLTTGGALDATFDTDGKVTVPIGASNDEAYGVAVDSLGRIIAAGRANLGGNLDFAVVRFTTVGGLDATFDSDGKTTFGFGAGQDFGFSVATDPNDRVVAAGVTFNGVNNDFAVARLTASGALDPAFDGDGKQTITFGPSFDEAFGVSTLDSNGRVVVAGFCINNGTSFAVARLDNGALTAELIGNDLIINDVANVVNNWTISYNGTHFIISDAVEQFRDPVGNGTLSADHKTLTILASDFTGTVKFLGQGGNDQLTSNFAIAFPRSVSFDGGTQTSSPGDKLTTTGGSFALGTHTFTGSGSGGITLGTNSISYTGLEPVDMTGSTIADLIFNLPATASDSLLEDDGIGANNKSQIRSNNGTFETTLFSNPTNSLTVNRGNSSDSVTMAALPDFDRSLAIGSLVNPFLKVTVTDQISLASNFSFTVHAAGTIDFNSANSDLTTVGTGTIGLSSGSLSLASGATLTSATAGGITLEADAIAINGVNTISVGAGTINVRPLSLTQQIDLGGADGAGTLGLTSAELNTITAGTMVIGSTGIAKLTVSNSIALTAATDVELISGDDVVISANFDTAGGTLVLHPGTTSDAVQPVFTGTDATASTVSFASDLELSFTNKSTYDQLTVDGDVDLSGVQLVLSGGHIPSIGEVFTIVSTTGTITNTFTNLPASNDTINLNGKILIVNYQTNAITLTAAAEVTVAVAPGSVGEDGGTNLDFTFTRTGPTTSAMTVSFTVAGGAVFGTDYTQSGAATFGLISGTVVIPIGLSTAIVSIDPSVDSTVELDESVVLTVTTSGAYVPGVPDTASGTITNDDSATINLTGATVNEAAGTMTFTLSIDNPVDVPVTVEFDTLLTGTANSGTDFTAVTNFLVIFPANTTASQLVSVAIDSDQLVEADESVDGEINTLVASGRNVGLAGGGSSKAAIGSIDEDDSANVTVTGTANTSETGAADTLTATLTLSTIGAGAKQLTIPISVSLISALDFASDTVSFGVGSLDNDTATLTVTAVDDQRLEGSESLTGSATGASGVATVNFAGTPTVNVTDNETAVIDFATDDSVGEAGSTKDFTATMTITATGVGTIGLDVPVIITIGLGGTASDPADYTLSATSMTFTTGNFTAQSQTITATIADDRRVEGGEAIVATITGGLPALSGQVTAGDNNQTISITDNDSAVIDFAADDSIGEAGGTKDFTATMTITPIGTGTVGLDYPVVITVGFAGSASDPADYTVSSTSMTFAAGNFTTQSQTITATIADDRLLEGDESIIGTIDGGLPALSGQVTAGDTSQTISINDSESASLAIDATSSTSEGGGAQNIGVTLTIVGSGSGVYQIAAGVTVSADVVDAGTGSALTGTDYSAFGTQTVTFVAGDQNGKVRNATLTVTDDQRVEGSETVHLALQNVVASPGSVAASLGNTSNVTTNSDNDTAQAVFSSASSIEIESVFASTRTVTLNLITTGVGAVGLDQTIIVRVSLNGGGTTASAGSDFGFTNPTDVSFGPVNGTSFSQNIGLSFFDDLAVEGAEFIQLDLSIFNDGTGGQASVGSPGSHTVTLNDNDTATSLVYAALVADEYTFIRNGGSIELYQGVTLVALTAYGAGYSITFEGSSGVDTVNFDYSAGEPVPGLGSTFNGNDPTIGAGDIMRIKNGTYDSIIGNFTGVGTGNFVMDPTVGVNTTINYTGLEPVLINVGSVTDIIFNLPAAATVATLGDDGAANTLSRLSGNTFELTDFTNPSNSLTVNGDAGAFSDSITVNSLPDFAAALTVTGGGGTDSINFATALTTTKDLVATAEAIRIGADVSTTGSQTFNGPVNVAGTRTLTANGAGNDINFNGAVDATTPGVDELSAVAIDEVVFSTTVGAANRLGSLNATSGGLTRIGGNISTDSSSGKSGNVSFTLTGLVVFTTSVTIDTESGDGNAGSINLFSATVSGLSTGTDLNLDTTTGVGKAGGSVTLAAFSNSGGAFINDLSIATGGGAGNGTITLNNNIQLDDNGAADFGDFNVAAGSGAIVLGASVVIDTEQGNSASGGFVSVGTSTISSGAVGRDLSIITATTLAGGNGGAISLNALANAGGAFVNDLNLDSSPGAGGTGGVITLVANISLDDNTAVDAGSMLVAANSGSIVLGASLTIDTDQAPNVKAGDVNLGTSSVSGNAVGRNLIIDTTSGVVANAGNVTLAAFNSSGGALINNLSINTAAAAGSLTITTGIQIAGVMIARSATFIDSSSAVTDVAASKLALQGVSGINTSGNPLKTAVGNLEAAASIGGIFINNTGNVIIGGVSAALAGVQATTSGDLTLVNNGSVSVTLSGEHIRAAAGNIVVQASSVTGDIVTGNNSFFPNGNIRAFSGTLNLTAGRDVILGSSGFYGDIGASGNVTVSANRHVVVQDFTFLFSTAGKIDITAGLGGGVGDVSVIVGSLDGSAILTGGGSINVTTAPNGVFTHTPGIGGVIDSGGGAITINADDMVIGNPMDAGGAIVTLQPVSAGRAMTLGGTTVGELSLTDAELDQITAGLLIAGKANAGAITFAGDVDLTATETVSNLHLISSLGITATAGGVLVDNLALSAGGIVNFTDTSTDVDTLAIVTSNDNTSFRDVDGLDIASLDGVIGVQVGSANFSLTAGGAVTQTQAIVGAGLELLGTGSFTLNLGSNDVDSIAGATTGAIAYVDADDLDVGTVNTSGLTASANIDLTSLTGNLTGTTAITATGAKATLTATAGSIVDGNGVGTNNVTAVDLIATAKSGIDLDTKVGSITATTTSAGAIALREFDAVTLTNVTTFNGPIAVTAGGTITATQVVSSTDSDANDINITATAGDINVSTIDAGTNSGDVNLLASAGSVVDNANPTTLSADVVTITADRAIGQPAVGGEIDTTANSWLLSTSGSGFGAGPTPGIWVSDTNAINVPSATTIEGIVVLASGSSMTVSTITAGGAGSDLRLHAISGNVFLGTVDASGDAAIIQADGGAIIDNNGSPNKNVVADRVALNAATGIGAADSIELAVGTFAATSTVGDIVLDNFGATTIGVVAATLGVGPFAGVAGAGSATITTHSPMNVNSNVIMGGAVLLEALGTSDFPACVDDVNINAGVTVQSTGSSVTIFAEDDTYLDATASIIALTTVVLEAAHNDSGDMCGGLNLLGSISAGGNLDVCSADDISLGSLNSLGTITVRSMNGAISDGNTVLPNLTAPATALSASKGIGTFLEFLESAVGNIEAETFNGGVFVDNSSAALVVGGVTPGCGLIALNGYRASLAGDVNLKQTGSLQVNEEVSTGLGNADLKGSSIDLAVRVAATGTATLDATSGAISDSSDKVAGTEVQASLLIATATGGIELDTAVAFMTVTANGATTLREVDGVQVNSIIAGGNLILLSSTDGVSTFTLQPGDALDNASTVEVDGGTTADLNGDDETIGALHGAGNVVMGNRTLTTGGNGASTAFSGVISGLNGSLIKFGAGTMILSGANTYTGITSIFNGAIALGANNVLDDASSLVVNGAAAAFVMTTFNDAVFAVSLIDGSITGTIGILTSSNNFDMRNGLASAKLAGAVGLVKSTGGTVTLSGANTYTGTTVINGGVLNYSGSLTGAGGDVILNAAAVTLDGKGSGVITGRGVQVAIGKTNTFVQGLATLTNGPTGTGLTINTGASATIRNNSITNNQIGILVDGATALIESNKLNNNTFGNGSLAAGLVVQKSAIVDAGQLAGPFYTHFTGLAGGTGPSGASAGLNTFLGYPTLGVNDFQPTVPKAIRNNNTGGAYAASGPQFGVLDLTALNNTFDGTPNLFQIEVELYHDLDDPMRGFIDYGKTAAPTPATLLDLRYYAYSPTADYGSDIDDYVSITSKSPTGKFQASVIRRVQAVFDGYVYLDTSFSASVLPTGSPTPSKGPLQVYKVNGPALTNSNTSGFVPVTAISGVLDQMTGQYTVTWSFQFVVGGPYLVEPNGSLSDGNYQLALVAGAFQGGGPGGAPLTNPGPVRSFHRFFGDHNGDRRVDNTDLKPFNSALAAGIPANSGWRGYFNFDTIDAITSADQSQFNRRYKQILNLDGTSTPIPYGNLGGS